MTSELSKVQIRLLYSLMGILAVGAVTWCSWVSVTLMSVPTRMEVKEIVRDNGPYVAEKRAINDALKRAEESESELTAAIAALTEESAAIRSQMATQTTSLAALNRRLDENMQTGHGELLEEMKALRKEIASKKE